MIEREHEQTAREFCEALKKMASNPAALENFQHYLAYHFADWLTTYANTPEDITDELKQFAEIEL